MMKRWFTTLLVAGVSACTLADDQLGDHPGSEELISRAVSEYQLDAALVQSLLDKARYQQSIIDAITRPAEGKPWHQYRPIFITDKRIKEGVAFWEEHRDLVEGASQRYGVDPEIIVAVIGVETFYGRITGSYRVLDALATLGLYYPKRAQFFSDELLQFIVLSSEEELPVDEVKGSYAGAMGLGQFIPSSYRAYAVDFDGDGRRDLWSSRADAIGSVANYLHVHGWDHGEPVMVAATVSDDADHQQVSSNYKPGQTLAHYNGHGFSTEADIEAGEMAALLKLEEAEKDSHWLTFNNFYVITRYNRSPLYATAVYQLSQAIREGFDQL